MGFPLLVGCQKYELTTTAPLETARDSRTYRNKSQQKDQPVDKFAIANLPAGWFQGLGFRVCPGAIAIWNKKVWGLRKRHGSRAVVGLGRRRVVGGFRA